MSIVPPFIPSYVPIVPVSNITPFTYRDGITYIEKLEGLQSQMNALVEFVNVNFELLEDTIVAQINELIQQVNDALVSQATAVNEALAAQSAAVTLQLATQDAEVSATLTAQTAEVDAKIAALEADVAAAIVAVNNSIAANAAYVDEQVALVIGNSIVLQDDVMAAIVVDNTSDTRAALDTLYSGGGSGSPVTDSDIADIINNPASDTTTALNTLYANASYEVIIDTGRLSETAIDTTIGTQISAIDYDTEVHAVVNNPASATTTLLDTLYDSVDTVIPLTRGGTGAINKAAARIALGITSGTGPATGGDPGDIYFEITVP
jgi:hypothetical protein